MLESDHVGEKSAVEIADERSEGRGDINVGEELEFRLRLEQRPE